MSEEPWFRMRPSKFMAGCRGLNANEVKAYISLICRIMEHGSPVEEDHEILATYCEMRPSSFAAALERLIRLKKLVRTTDGHLSNAFCDGEIAWRASYSENQKRAGEKSAAKRKEKQHTFEADVEPTFNQKIEREKEEEKIPPKVPPGRGDGEAPSSPPAPARKRRTSTLSTELEAEFRRVWQHYPRKVGCGAAEAAWAKARLSNSFEEITGPLGQFIRAVRGSEPSRIPHLSTWLNEKRWRDDQTHARNEPRSSTEDLDRLSRISAADDIARLMPPPVKAIP